jgi:NADP-dependent 3-hydroxy acid dehydrogenase YdfG
MEVQKPHEEDIKKMIEINIKNFIEATRLHLFDLVPNTQQLSTNLTVECVR